MTFGVNVEEKNNGETSVDETNIDQEKSMEEDIERGLNGGTVDDNVVDNSTEELDASTTVDTNPEKDTQRITVPE